VWGGVKAQLQGTWGFSGNGVTAHSFLVNDLANARRTLPVPNGETRYSGKFAMIAGNRVKLSNYLTSGQELVFDMVVAPNAANGNLTVFMSPDGKYYLTRISNAQ